MNNQEVNRLSGMRILVVNDNLIVQRLIIHLLTQMEVSADFAVNGAKAVEMVSENSYDAVLMDIFMPGMDGYEATHAIRSMEGEYFRNLPIIAFTRMPDLQKMRQFGITDVFTDMPLLEENLYNVLSRYLK
jgi:CheY-like chemotaxis protein